MAGRDGRRGGGPPRPHRRGAGGARAAIGRSLESARHARRQWARRIRLPPCRPSGGGRRAMIRASAAGVGLIGCCAMMARIPNLVGAPGIFLLLFFLAFACYVAGVCWLPASDGPRAVAAVLTIGLIARLVLLPVVPTLSTDVYRYVWDARVAHAGISPYAYPPSARELEPLRDLAVFPHLNHPTWRTIYPPAAQTFFRLLYHGRPDSVSPLKLAVRLPELIRPPATAGL